MHGKFLTHILLILYSFIYIAQAKLREQNIECPSYSTKIFNVCYKVYNLKAGLYDSANLSKLCEQEDGTWSVAASFTSRYEVRILQDVLGRNFIFLAKNQLIRKWRRRHCRNFKCQLPASVDSSSDGLSIARSSAALDTCPCADDVKIMIKAEENIGILCQTQPPLESKTLLPKSTPLKGERVTTDNKYVSAKKSALSTKSKSTYLKIKGYPCGKYNPKRQRTGQTVTFDKKHTVYYRTPKWWKPGKYVCVWDLKVILNDDEQSVVKRKQELGVLVKFRRLSIAKDVDGSCYDTLTIAGSKTDLKNTYEANCRNSSKIYKVNSDTVQVKLTIHLQKNRSLLETEQITTFAVHFTPMMRDDTPRRYMVEDIPGLFPESSVKGNDFTWADARDFCQRLGQDKDLCSAHEICPQYDYIFRPSDGSKDGEGGIEYLPIDHYYNFWVKVNASHTDCDRVLYFDIYQGPQPWGYGSSKCPVESCAAKKSITCCVRYEYITHYQPRAATKIQLAVTTLRVDFKKYRYRFAYPESDDDRLDRLAHLTQKFLDWHPHGRTSGDVTSFALYADYTQNFSTPVYFCRKNARTDFAEDISMHWRYKISLRPCYELRNWEVAMYMYTSLKPQPGTKRLYVASTSNDEDGESRISITPPCCGYNEENFVMYGFVEDEWIAEDTSDLCKYNNDNYEGPSGEISSPPYPDSFSNFLDCSWTITVRPGYGILIRFLNISFDYRIGCSANYLEFIDGTTNRSLGRLCENKAEHFLSPSSVVVVRFSLKVDFAHSVFLLTYNEMPIQSPIPLKFAISSGFGTWKAAGDLCENSGMTLCRSTDICFPNSLRVEYDDNDDRWVAVKDRFNEWVHIRPLDYYNCKKFSSSFGPPEWGLHTAEGCVLNEERPRPTNKRYLPTRDPEFSNICTIKRDLVYCCLFGETQINEPDIEFVWPPPTLPVVPIRVYVSLYQGYTMTYYRFATGENWSSPEYEVIEHDDYYHDYDYGTSTTNKTTVKPWKLPSTVPGAGVVDYFTLSSEMQKSHFEQVVYFCSYRFSSFVQTEIKKDYKVSLQRCDMIRGWQLEFFLYAAKTKTDLAPVPLFVTSPRYNYGIDAPDYGTDDTQDDDGIEGKYVSLAQPDFNYTSKFTLYVSDAGTI